MKRRLSLVIVLIAVVVVAFVPVKQNCIVKVNASYYNCYRQLFVLNNWKRWNPEIKKVVGKDSSLVSIKPGNHNVTINIPDGTYKLQQASSNTLFVNIANQGKQLPYTCTIISDSAGLNTTLVVTLESNVIKWLIPSLLNNTLIETGIIDFKRFMEDKALYYGFNIRTEYQGEQEIVVKSKTVPKKNVCENGVSMLNEIRDFVKKENIKTSGKPLVQYISHNKDSVQMMIGLPINKKWITSNEFKLMHVPGTRILVAKYNDNYRNRQAIYKALETFIQDKLEHPKIAPMESFESGFPPMENSVTTFKLIYPIF